MSAWLEPLLRADELVFRAPERAWLALPLLLVLLLAPWTRRRAARTALVPALLRALVFAALLAVLLDPALPDARAVRGDLLVLADVSPSVGAEGCVEAEALLRTAPRPPPVLPFGAAPSPLLAPPGALHLAPDPRPSTDIGAALRASHARLRDDRPLRVVLVGDGRATVPGAEEAARAIRRAGVELFAIGVPRAAAPVAPPAMRVDALVAPPPSERRQPFAMRARIHADGARAAHALLFVDGEPRGSVDVALGEGDTEIALPEVALEPGRYLVQVAVEPDATPADDVAQAVVVVPDVPRVLVLAAHERKTLIGEALSVQGFDVRVAAPQDAGVLDGYDAIVLEPDVPRDAIEAASDRLLDFVKRRGGGLLAVGGTEGAGLARLHGTPLSLLLPLDVPARPEQAPEVQPEPPAPDAEPQPRISIEEREADAFPITLCLLVDRSGSMRGEKIARAREAAVAAAAALTGKDRIAVVAFGDAAEIVLPPQPAGDPERVYRGLRGLDAQGQTAMYAALELGAGLMEKETTAIRHLVILSDGEPTDSGAWRDTILGLTRAGVTVSTVGIGERTDSRLMITFARWGAGRYWTADRPDQIPQVITLDTQRLLEARRDKARRNPSDLPELPDKERPPPQLPEPEKEPEPLPPPTPLELRGDPGAPREMLAGLEDGELPGVTGVEEGTPRLASWVGVRAGEEPRGEGEAGVPVVLYRRSGLGSAAVLASDPEAPSNTAFREHPEFPRLIAQLVRSVLPDARGDPIALETAAGPRALSLRVRGEDGRARTDLRVVAKLDGRPLELTRRADRYGAPLPAREGFLPLEVTVEGAAGPLLARRLVLPPDPPRELRERGVDRRSLVRLAGAADRVDRPPAEVLVPPTRLEPFSRSVALPFLLLAAILLPFDAWARRRAASASR